MKFSVEPRGLETPERHGARQIVVVHSRFAPVAQMELFASFFFSSTGRSSVSPATPLINLLSANPNRWNIRISFHVAIIVAGPIHRYFGKRNKIIIIRLEQGCQQLRSESFIVQYGGTLWN